MKIVYEIEINRIEAVLNVKYKDYEQIKTNNRIFWVQSVLYIPERSHKLLQWNHQVYEQAGLQGDLL